MRPSYRQSEILHGVYPEREQSEIPRFARNDSEGLRMTLRELVATVQRNTTIDWTVRENVRAHLRVLVKRILRKYGYPPGKQEKATQTVLEQAEVLSANWATA
jgi:hypothetical protein